MNETGQLLERVGERFPFPETALEGLRRRRDRKRRNERIAAAALALILATAAIGGAAQVFLRSEGRRPATGITRQDVRSLALEWTGQTHHVAGSGMRTPEPVVHDGIVYGVSDRLYAFSASCGTDGTTCDPLWKTQQDSELWAWPPAFDGDRIFMVAASRGVFPDRPQTPSEGGYRPGRLFAYDGACGTGGVTCDALWSARMDEFLQGPPVVSDRTVFVSSTTGRFDAFSADCSSGGSTCEPSWSTDLGASASYGVPLTASDGAVYGMYKGRLFALPSTCESSSCPPLWSSERLTSATRWASWPSPVVEGDTIAVTSARPNGGSTLEVFSAACSSPCAPIWRSRQIPAGQSYALSGPVVSLDDGLVVVTADIAPHPRDGAELLAYPLDCSDPCSPIWTAIGLAINAGPVIDDGHVFASGLHGLLAFSVDCATAGRRCQPDWVGPAAAAPAFTPNGYPGGVCGSHPCGPGGGPPVVADGVVFSAPSNGHAVYAFATDCGSKGATCDPVWTGSTHGLIRSGLAMTDRAIYVGTGDGKIVAFGLGGSAGAGGSGGTSALGLGLAAVALAALGLVSITRAVRGRRGAR